MAFEDLNAYLDGLDQEMLDAYEEYAWQVVEYWSSFQGNEGQMTIVYDYILPTVVQHAKDAKPDWPESATPEDLLDALYNCYDPEVMERAFSDSIEDCVGEVTQYWMDAEGIQYEHAYAAGPDNAGPHSTHKIWRG